ncbi:hypothetical protein [Actinoplanes regularis]|uniref:hypothetical protein n=1 Tax=Actinoplanes regularis TaxID=52697 RepID=UPI0024A5B993|nr:hypothetical protein [Actinoplanes regularis]GLW34454.1 hypothetical protein Areg01_73910 [Actinoplanes regularis]
MLVDEMFGRLAADRLILISEVAWFYLPVPILVWPGQTYWIDFDRNELCVDRGRRRVTRHGFVTGHAGWMRR